MRKTVMWRTTSDCYFAAAVAWMTSGVTIAEKESAAFCWNATNETTGGALRGVSLSSSSSSAANNNTTTHTSTHVQTNNSTLDINATRYTEVVTGVCTCCPPVELALYEATGVPVCKCAVLNCACALSEGRNH